MALVTFIIPTVGRPTLQKTLDSLLAQSNSKWEAIVVGDGISVEEIDDPRIQYMSIPKIGFKNCAGKVRSAAAHKVTTECVGFVDDDDILFPNYVQALHDEAEHGDLIVFRMRMGERIVPNPRCTSSRQLMPADVGISFSLKSSIFKANPMEPSMFEDFTYLDRLRREYKVHVSNAVTYNVRPK